MGNWTRMTTKMLFITIDIHWIMIKSFERLSITITIYNITKINPLNSFHSILETVYFRSIVSLYSFPNPIPKHYSICCPLMASKIPQHHTRFLQHIHTLLLVTRQFATVEITVICCKVIGSCTDCGLLLALSQILPELSCHLSG
jgi:hypothetical protein